MARYWRKITGILVLIFPAFAISGNPVYELIIRDHLFYPSELVVPAGEKIKLLVINEDDTPEEFESYELNREKVILGGRRTVIYIGPLRPGVYPFFGEFNMATAQGRVVAK